eukprot:3223006-Amphidinium_carterae.1
MRRQLPMVATSNHSALLPQLVSDCLSATTCATRQTSVGEVMQQPPSRLIWQQNQARPKESRVYEGTCHNVKCT